MATKLRVLMLEDNAADAELVLHALRRAEFDPIAERVETEQDYRDCLQRAPQIILADFTMPEFGSLHALEILQECQLDIPFIIVSGTIGEERAVQAMQHGAADYLIKDRLERLGQAVARALENKLMRNEARLAELRLKAQYATTKVLAESANLETAVPQIIKAVCQSMKWPWAAVWMVGMEGQRLVLIQFWHSPVANLDQFLTACRNKTFSPGEGLPGRVWAAGKAVWVPDVIQDENFFGKYSAAKAGLHAAVGFPILRGQEVLGVVEFFSQRIEQPDENLLGMMTAIGSQIGQFIEKKQTETALDKEREFLKAVLENVQDGIVACDSQGILSFINRAAREFYGKTEQPLPTQKLLEEFTQYHADGKSLLTTEERPLYRALHGERVREMEIVNRRQGEAARTLLVSGETVTDAKGKQLGAVVVWHDVTERHALLARLQLHIERMPLAYILFDADLRVSDWNPTAERIFGYAKSEAIGMAPFDLFPVSFRREAEEILRRIRGGDMTAHSVNDNVTKDGRTITCEWLNTPLFEEDGRFAGILCLARDVTERRNLEEQFRQAQKMEAFGQLAGGVAHDFNNLLTIISGYSELMLESVRPDDPNREMIQEILKAGERAALLTRQLLAFSRKQVVQPQVLDLNGVVASAGKMLGRLIGEDVNLATLPSPGLNLVKVDPGQVEQVIVNLVVNARDAMPRGGKITIETANVDLDESCGQSHTDFKPGRYVLLAVSDTGGGMTEEVKRKIFEPFFTTKEVGKGTGLGLATVFGIVKQSGGHIRVYSEVGYGSTFKIYLPAVSEAVPAVRQTAGEPAQATHGNETILLVEDEKGVRELTRLALQSKGYTLFEAANGAEAIRHCEQYAGPIHLLVTDVVMPQMGGRELAERLTALHPETRVLFVSGYTDDAVVRHGVLQAEVAFLQKPFSMDALHRKVRTVLDGVGRTSLPNGS